MPLETKGYLSLEEVKNAPAYPSEARFAKGPVAVIECTQEIPCNPCEAACPFGAIKVGEPITNRPVLNEEKCIGCEICIARCPGLAIFVVDKTYSETMASISFPYEYLPLPRKGEKVVAVDRSGNAVCEAEIIKINASKKNDKTTVLSISVPREKSDEVRSIKRLKGWSV